MSKPLILVVDDEKQMLSIVGFALETQGFECVFASDATTAWSLIQAHDFDLVVLDIMLPHGSGLDLTKRIRARSLKPAIILLTALSSDAQRIAGLEAGADDYLTKPFSPRELALRVEAILRRFYPSEPDSPSYNQLRVNSHRISYNDRILQLTDLEFRFLSALVKKAPKPINYASLLNEVWETAETAGGKEMIKTSVYRLRKKLEKQGLPADIIESVRGDGYRLRG